MNPNDFLSAEGCGGEAGAAIFSHSCLCLSPTHGRTKASGKGNCRPIVMFPAIAGNNSSYRSDIFASVNSLL